MSPNEIKLIELARKYGITDKRELAHLLGQCHHESAGFTQFSENLNYTSDKLISQWGKYFTKQTAEQYGRTANHAANQRMIANIAYGSRFGNNPKSDDGYNYRGRGVIQVTFLDNYRQFNYWLNANGYKVDIVRNPDLVANDPILKLLCGVWFWLSHGIGQHARANNFAMVTKIINGGDRGLAERTQQTNIYFMVL